MAITIEDLESKGLYYDPDTWYDSSRFQVANQQYLDLRPKDIGLRGFKRLRFGDLDQPLHKSVRKALETKYVSQGLLGRVLAKTYLSKPLKDLLRFERHWMCVEDNLLLSMPEVYCCKEHHWYLKKIFRWVTALLTYGNEDTFWKVFKQSMHHIWCRCTQTHALEDTLLPGSFPGSVIKGDGEVVLQSGPSWLLRAYHEGVKAKGQTTRLVHFCSTRNFPAPAGTDSQRLALAKHQKTLTTLPANAVSEERLAKIAALSRRVARRVDPRNVNRTLINPCHVSVTNRSSYDFSRSDGGRAAEVQFEYELWASRVSVIDVDCPAHLVWDNSRVLHCYEDNWRTFIKYPLRFEEEDPDVIFGQAYKTPLGAESHFGFNRNVGVQLLQCAYEAGVRAKVLRPESVGLLNEEPDGYSDQPRYFKEKPKFPFVRTSICGEPGLKNRIYTISEWWVTILLQPLGHILTEILKDLPSCRSGLSRSDAMWDWVNDFSMKSQDLNTPERLSQLWLLTSDLETATDYCDHIVCRTMLHAFFDELGLTSHFDGTYLHFSIDLLLSSRSMETRSPT